MEELLTVGANMNVSLLAVLPGEGREPKAARADGVPVPQHSGFIASLVCGDYVFVAGQMPNNEAMTGLDPKAYRPPNAVWNGTDIRLQTEFLISVASQAGLEAGGSSLKNAIKAQVYLTDINDLPEFMDVWNSHFADNPCALTVVATKGLALLESKIEINIFGVRDNGKIKKQIIDHKASARCGLARQRWAPAICCACPRSMRPTARARFPRRGPRRACVISARRVQHQMRAILGAAEEICKAGGTSLANVVRAHHFVGDLNVVYPALRIWQEKLSGAPIPFGAVRTPMAIPGCDIVMDMWAYNPHAA